MWDLEKIDSQNIEVQETKNIVRHPEGVQAEKVKLKIALKINGFQSYFNFRTPTKYSVS